MNPKDRNRLGMVAALALLALFALTLIGCSERDLTSLKLASAEADPVVFSDAFGSSLDYAAWSEPYTELSQDQTVFQSGSASLKVSVPATGWVGGAFWTHNPRDLSSFNALTFYVRSNHATTLDECGFGIGVANLDYFKAAITSVPLTGAWSQVIVPIPNPARLTSERGMFWYSEAAEGNTPGDIWFDEVIYKNVAGITDPRPVMTNATVEALLGEAVPITGTQTTFNVNGEDIEVVHAPSHFTYFSSDEAVAVAEDGLVTVVGGGTAVITAKLGTTDVVGEVNITVPPPPTAPAPAPTLLEDDVISLFSDEYTDVPVDSWLAVWSTATGVFDQQISGDNVKVYTGLESLSRYASIDFQSNQIDATTAGMTHFHLDVWAPSGTLFYFELIDFGPDGVFDTPANGGDDDTNKKLLFFDATDPSFAPGEWSSLDIPLSSFTDMNFGNVAQFNIQTGDGNTVYVDNVYFHK